MRMVMIVFIQIPHLYSCIDKCIALIHSGPQFSYFHKSLILDHLTFHLQVSAFAHLDFLHLFFPIIFELSRETTKFRGCWIILH